MILSLDIETYGAAETDIHGRPLPAQSGPSKKDGRFHPMRAVARDNPHQLILTCSVTEVLGSLVLGEAKPGETRVFLMHLSDHRKWLAQWLDSATALLGMNLLFDLSFLRHDGFRNQLNGRHILYDLSIFNYLHSEVRTARSLKTLGPVLRTHSYKESLKTKRFPTVAAPLISYNAQDSHNTILAASELCRRIITDYPEPPVTYIPAGDGSTIIQEATCQRPLPSLPYQVISSLVSSSSSCSSSTSQTHPHPPLAHPHRRDKLSPYCITHYSNLIWSCLRMMEDGIPMSRSALTNLRSSLQARKQTLLPSIPFAVSGKGSDAPKKSFVVSVAKDVATSTDPNILNHPLLKLTDKKKEVSWANQNRILFQCLLPDNSPHQPVLAALNEISTCDKLISAYITPLLDHKTDDPTDLSSVLSSDGIAYPNIYLVPSHTHDDANEDGGQQQGRISFKKPAGQTFPKPIKKCLYSRFGFAGAITSYDLSQAELRVAAVLSGEPSLVTAFRTGLDLHTTRAESTFGIANLIAKYGPDYRKSEAFSALERQAGKHGNFTDLNWGSALTLRRTILVKGKTLIPMSICEEVVNSRSRVRPVLFKWQCDWVKQVQKDHGCVLPFTGQSRSFTGVLQGNDINEAINFPIQCHAANLMLAVQGYCHRRFADFSSPYRRIRMFLNTYDALSFDHPQSLSADVDAIFHEAFIWLTAKDYWKMFCDYYGNDVPLAYD